MCPPISPPLQLAAKIAVNSTLGAGTGGLTTLLLTVLLGGPGDIGPLLNGIIAGNLAEPVRRRAGPHCRYCLRVPAPAGTLSSAACPALLLQPALFCVYRQAS